MCSVQQSFELASPGKKGFLYQEQSYGCLCPTCVAPLLQALVLKEVNVCVRSREVGEGKERVRAGTSMSWGIDPWGHQEILSLKKQPRAKTSPSITFVGWSTLAKPCSPQCSCEHWSRGNQRYRPLNFLKIKSRELSCHKRNLPRTGKSVLPAPLLGAPQHCPVPPFKHLPCP